MSEELQQNGPGEQGGSEGVAPAAVAAPTPALPPAPGPTANEGEIQWDDAPAPAASAPAAPDAPDAPTPAAIPPPPPPTEGENAASAPSDFSANQLQNGTWELRTPTGNVYKGATELAAYQAAARGKVEADRTIRELREKIAGPAAPAAAPASPSSTPPTIDPTAELIADFTAQGMGFANAKEMRAAFQGIQESVRSTSTAAEDYRAQQASLAFVQSTPDFTPTESNIAKLDEGMSMLSRLAGLPDGQTLPVTVDNIRAAHFLVKGQGLYETVKPEQIVPAAPAPATPRTPTGQFAPRSNVMPMPPAATAPAPRAAAPDPFAMSDADWTAYVANQPRSA